MTERIAFAPSGRFGVSDRRAVLEGRDTELRDLEQALSDVREKGEARSVTVIGASGIGKTRLARDFLIQARDHSARVYRGSARESGPAYEVLARVLRARFGIVEGMDSEAQKAQVRAQVASVLEDRKVGDVCYFLGQLLDLSFLDSPLVRAVEGDRQQLSMLRRAVIRQFLEIDAAKGQGPLVLVLDDLQWAHDESLEHIESLIDTVRGPVLLLLCARPDMLARRGGWLKHGGSNHKLLELAPLSDGDSSIVMNDLLAPCAGAEGIQELVDAACSLAGGNPALLEQMVRIYLDAGVLEVNDSFDEERWSIHVDKLADVELPITVEGAVQARISALTPDERDLLEHAVTMGSVFWLGGLLAGWRRDKVPPPIWNAGPSDEEGKIRTMLNDLTERDYILRLPDSTFANDEEYVFKHNLEREQIVRFKSPTADRDDHCSIAEWLAFKDNIRTNEEYLSMLARHREKAGAIALAARAYVDAADVARGQYANSKAAEYYAKALALIGSGAELDAHQRISLHHHYGDVLQALGRTTDALQAFRDMLARAYQFDLKSKGGAAHSRIGRLFREIGQLEGAMTHLEAALQLFVHAKDERGIASTLDDIGKLHWMRGDYPKALDYTERALEMRRTLGDRRSIALSLNNLGLVYQDSGDYKKALDAFEQALQIRRAIGDLVGVSITLNNLGTVAQDQHDDARALALFNEALDVAKETGNRNRMALILTNIGQTHTRLGDAKTAITYLKQAEELADELGDKLGLAEAVRGLGKAYLSRREYGKARECTGRAVDLFREVESQVQLGVALRSLAEVIAASGSGGRESETAANHLKQSIAIFEGVGNELELARSCRAYAEVLRAMPTFLTDPAVGKQAQEFGRRADDIFAKLRRSVGSMPERSTTGR